MLVRSKLKYRFRGEPDHWKNQPRHKNTKQMGSGSSFSGKRKVPKGVKHPIGMSGRTLGTH